MKSLFTRLLLVCILATGTLRVEASPTTSMAVIFSEADNIRPISLAELTREMEATSRIEMIHLNLNEIEPPRFSRLLMAATHYGDPIRLAAADGYTGPIAVLYPDISEPYRSVFSTIIDGIEANSKTKVSSYAVGKSFNADAISGELKRQDIRVVIALGRNGLKAASALDKEIGIVAGGVVTVSETNLRNGAILSLAPDPALLFSRLKAVSPKIRRIFFVYDPAQNNWLIKLARKAALTLDIELVARQATDLKTALGLYKEFFDSADPRQDALWLPQDSNTVDDSLVLPLILQESWSKNLVVFSSNVSHVKRGVLFALYPNNEEIGKSLAISALGMANGDASVHGVMPLRSVLAAFNTRTASHLGLSSSLAMQGFDLLFPEQ